MKRHIRLVLGVLVGGTLACSGGGLSLVPSTAQVADGTVPIVASPIPVTVTLPPTATETPLPSTSTPELTPTPLGCGARPPDDYSRLLANGWTLNVRTVEMLKYSQSLYGGVNNLLLSVTQGSYNISVSASFGTHDGGGAVDLSVHNQGAQTGILSDQQVEVIIQAMRRAGFAAWYRAFGDLYDGSPAHIHAIAVGDAELSEAASLQLTGESGYFRGSNGLPDERGLLDRHGGPVLCPWMVELGYSDLRDN